MKDAQQKSVLIIIEDVGLCMDGRSDRLPSDRSRRGRGCTMASLISSVVLVSSVALFNGCARTSAAGGEPSDFEVPQVLSSEPRFLMRLDESSCWAGGLFYRLTVFEDGRIELRSKSDSAMQPDRLTPQQLSALRAAFREADFFAHERMGMSFGTTPEVNWFQKDIRITYQDRGKSGYVQFTSDLTTVLPALVHLREQIIYILEVPRRFPWMLKPELCCG